MDCREGRKEGGRKGGYLGIGMNETAQEELEVVGVGEAGFGWHCGGGGEDVGKEEEDGGERDCR